MKEIIIVLSKKCHEDILLKTKTYAMRNSLLKYVLSLAVVFGLSNLAAQPLGTSCADAIPVADGVHSAAIGDGVASNQCFGSGGDNAVWYSYTATADQDIVVTSTNDPNQTDTRVSIYTGTCDDLTCLAFDDDGGEVFTSEVAFSVTSGTTYYIEWDDRWSGDPFIFEIGESDVVIITPGCTDPEATNYNPNANFDDGSCEYPLNCDDNLLMFEVINGSFAGEVSWNLVNEDNEVLYSGGADYGDVYQVCVSDGCYALHMFDSFGDGWGQGTISGYINGNLVFENLTIEDGYTGTSTFGINTEDCEEIVLEVPGCTDPEALNYSEAATIDDGSCQYPFTCETGVEAEFYLCTFSNGNEVNISITGDNGTTVFAQEGFNNVEIMYQDICLEEGVCYTVDMENSVGPYGWYGGYYWINLDGVTISTGQLYDGESEGSLIFSIDGTCGEIFGCMDSDASNYNPDATADDGSCIYPIFNDDCVNATVISGAGIYNVNNQGATSSGLYGDCWAFGSGEAEQNGVWFSFTTPDVPAEILLEAVSDGTNSLYDTQFGLYDECGGEMIACDGNGGDGLLSAFHFLCGELEASTTYYLLIDGYFGQQGTCSLIADFVICGNEVYGCTDPEALNYDPSATVDNGTCEYECEGNTVEIFIGGDPNVQASFIITDEWANIYHQGSSQFELDYLDQLCLPDGCYDICFFGGMESSSFDFIMTYMGETVVSGAFDPYWYECFEFSINSDCEGGEDIYGCTDSLAINYNPWATIDDGSCLYDVFDCDALFEIVEIDDAEDVIYILNSSVFNEDYDFFWDFGDGNTSTDPLPIHEYTEDGLYTVCLTIIGPDCEDTFCLDIYYENPGIASGGNNDQVVNGGFSINVVDSWNSIGDIAETIDFNVYPNPTSGLFNVSISENLTEVNMIVTDITGAKVWESNNISTASGDVVTIDGQTFAEGMYILQVNTGNAVSVKRFNVVR